MLLWLALFVADSFVLHPVVQRNVVACILGYLFISFHSYIMFGSVDARQPTIGAARVVAENLAMEVVKALYVCADRLNV